MHVANLPIHLTNMKRDLPSEANSDPASQKMPYFLRVPKLKKNKQMHLILVRFTSHLHGLFLSDAIFGAENPCGLKQRR
jgi:hypothetical protein